MKLIVQYMMLFHHRGTQHLNKHLLPVLVALLLLGSAAPGQQIVDGVAAVVEDEYILQSDIQQYAQMQAMQMGLNPYNNPRQFAQLQQQVLQSLIDQKIIQAKAEEDSIEVKDHEVEQALQQQIDNMLAQAGSEQALEEALGMSVKQIKREYREDVRKRLLVERYQATKFADVSVSRREVEKFYQTYKDSIPAMSKRVNISHIVIQVKPDASADSAAVRKLQAIKQQIKRGANFADLAQKFSMDPGSKQQGGDLGFVSRGTLVPEFEETAFALKEGGLSDVVKTEFGYHLIKLQERRGEKIHVKHILLSPEATDQNTQAVIDTLQNLRTAIRQGASFDSLARTYSEDSGAELNSGNLGWFEINKLQVPQFREIVDTMKIGEISQPFETEYGWHIVKLNDVKPGGKVTLENNWAEIEQMVLRQKQQQEYQKWLRSLRDQFYVTIKISPQDMN